MKPLSEGATLQDVIARFNELSELSSQNDNSNTNGRFYLQDPATDLVILRQDANAIWVLMAGYLVFFMHAGFSMLEVGSVRHKNAVNIMFKNLGTVAVGGVMYYLLGYGFAFGEDNVNNDPGRFIGNGFYANDHLPETYRHLWFFQFAFAATATTILSGAIAERVHLTGYLIVAAWMTSFVYPVITHWIWSASGWASAFTGDRSDTVFGPDGCGFLDFAGSGVVHLTGGVTAFYGSLIAGPRTGRYVFPEGTDVGTRQNTKLSTAQRLLGKFGFRIPGTVPVVLPAHNMAMITLGTLILWFGWYGFNTGSTLAFNGPLAAKAAITTTLTPSASVVTAIILSKFMYGHFDLAMVCNSALAGLVAITAGCTIVDDWAAVIIGIIAAFVYKAGSRFNEFIGIDDPVDAIAVHGWCGFWGVLAVGIFGTPALITAAYSVGDGVRDDCRGWETGLQFGTQLAVALAIVAWVTLMTVPLFILLKVTGFWRVPQNMELAGLDHSEHGGTRAFIGGESVTHPHGPVPLKGAVGPNGQPIMKGKDGVTYAGPEATDTSGAGMGVSKPVQPVVTGSDGRHYAPQPASEPDSGVRVPGTGAPLLNEPALVNDPNAPVTRPGAVVDPKPAGH